MKTLTCRQMGGMCDEEITGSSKDEIMMKGMEHLGVAHPEMAESVKKMSPADPLMVDWMKNFEAAYEAAPTVFL